MTRAQDIGSSFPSDAADTMPADPTDDFTEVDYDIPLPGTSGSGFVSNPLEGSNAYNREASTGTDAEGISEVDIQSTPITDSLTSQEALLGDITRIVVDQNESSGLDENKLAIDLDNARLVFVGDSGSDVITYLTLPIMATITSELGSGEYEWTKAMGDGPDSGTATELNLSTDITLGTVVVLHKVDDDYWFFYPVEICP